AANGMSEQALLGLAASMETGSEHPLAEAIVEGAKAREMDIMDAAGFEAITGKGVSGTVNGRTVALGNLAMMQDLGLSVAPLTEQADALRADGKTVMFIAIDDGLAGLVAVADPVKATTVQAI